MKEEKKINSKEVVIGAVAVVILIVVGAFLYIQSNKDNTTPEVEVNTGLTDEQKSIIEARINSAPVKELTTEEKKAIEKRINSAPIKELTPEQKSAIEARINQ